MEKERVEKIGKWADIIKPIGWINEDEHGFSREWAFEVRGAEYIVEWWPNMCLLKCGELTVLFDEFRYSGTWPNRFKTNIHFYYNGKICAIIPIEPYDEQ
ncbi:MAG: hypothetical protein ACRC3H_19610 [Lachnospiraceae bacterium]